MKTQLAGILLFTATTAAVALYPVVKSEAVATRPDPVPSITVPSTPPFAQTRPQIEVVFVLDTTSSMSGFIDAAKEKIWSIATTMSQADPAPEIKIGLVAFRDRGDEYVTRVIDLSADLDTVYSNLMDFAAAGGGDGPESVNQALYDAVQRVSWSNGNDAYKVVFLVGDAPPHMDYQDDVKYPETLKAAARKGIVVNTIQSGRNSNTEREWRRIAALNQGDFFNVGANGNAVAVTTPFDKEIATLSASLDETKLYFGDAAAKAKHEVKEAATEKLHRFASLASRARRAAFNASASGESNFLGADELVDAVTNGRLDLDELDEAELPSSLQAMAPAERVAVVENRAEQRAELQKKIKQLGDRRDDYISEKVAAEGGAVDSLDARIYGTVQRQAAAKGLHYEADAKY